ncbi:hypothetical protein CAP36_06565 [Chitinophagaceae bacterium IBVUCB2]|nr:hypothetical protein CAP36_06565 [Chitinophagaceae bacterium IBVUCB2]
MDSISIVIPTYNRPDQLSNVIDELLKSDISLLSQAEIIIVDDGSKLSAEKLLLDKNVVDPFSLKYIRQENSGPAAARNNGFRHASHNIVLFIDDDILAFPDMVKKHIEGHTLYPDSIIYGYCPYEVPATTTPAYRFLEKLASVNDDNNGFVKTTAIASGNISVEKTMFPDGEFYKSSLRTPVAEEFELMARLSEQKRNIYFNSSIRGWHLQPATINDKCKQEYKYGIGIAEVSIKVPYSVEHPSLQQLYYQNRRIDKADSLKTRTKKFFKSIIAQKWSRNFLLKMTTTFEKILPFDGLLFPLYRLLAGVFVFAGIRDGLKKFEKES